MLAPLLKPFLGRSAHSTFRDHAPHCALSITTAPTRVAGTLTAHRHPCCTFWSKNHTSNGQPQERFYGRWLPPTVLNMLYRMFNIDTLALVEPAPPAVLHCSPALTRLLGRAQRDLGTPRKPDTGVASEPKGDRPTPGMCAVHSARRRCPLVPLRASWGCPVGLGFLVTKVQLWGRCAVNTPVTRVLAGAMNKARCGA